MAPGRDGDFVELYHVTLRGNVESILAEGLRPSKGGLDGPGVYLWKGPLANAIKEADWSLSDNHSEMSQEEYEAFTRGLVMLAVTVPGGAEFAVEWQEYVVLDGGVIPAGCVVSLGSFDALLERFYPRQSVPEIIEGAAGRGEAESCDKGMRECEIGL